MKMPYTQREMAIWRYKQHTAHRRRSAFLPRLKGAPAGQASSRGSLAYCRQFFMALRIVSTWRSKRGQAWHMAM